MNTAGKGRWSDAARDIQVRLEGINLTPEGVATHRHVDAAELRWSARPSKTCRASMIIPAHDP